MTRQKSKFARYKILALCVAGVLIAWQFLKLPEMIDAILTFFLAGVVPGTHVVLSPNIVMLLSAIGVGVIIVAILLAPFIKHMLPRKHDRVDTSEDVEFQELVPQEHAAPATLPPLTPAEAFQQQMYVTAATAAAEASQPTSTVGILLNQAGESAATSMNRVMPRVFTLAIKTGVWLRPHLITARTQAIRAYYIAKRYAKIGWRWTVKELKLLWRWLLPQLKRFDRWLELQIRHIERRMRG